MITSVGLVAQWLEQGTHKPKVAGSNPLAPTSELLQINAPLAQRIEHLASDQRVGGSSPSGRTTLRCTQM